MNNLNTDKRLVNRMLWLFIVAILIHSVFIAAGAEQKLDVLKTKTETYKNVTVTKKTKDWVFILHAAGMVNIRISDLTAEAKRKLGYVGSYYENDSQAAEAGNTAMAAVTEEAPVSDEAQAVETGPSKIKLFFQSLATLPAK